ncbi:hypothetical protein AJ85_17075 [Alkalihalobacillus alcalophilus ATCC 27647 = CGMCC 1.3604]|uniref:Uncharacterized protein n=1 Tax=Alkalihalobacillus alcalophilus ATCC 27647 = CGMCC 1.3604 TaxID=1218173 RepID=A0A094YUR9_ALKAL|nr:hypothetical protein [Alkalihalobacillus alcalophilus]KGA97227.1 hypothetical protein BALCAV_0211515 [Alkalihalobacillus alcalophilus ATCC 27647 = CGMCC 1.3604]MED1561530.1 hypothetical protein [Alkalihalobacillus alcalophilus]THG89539.1 hypothetical protein AJ85_17075 [Alkalihalobacillus alcalophilus ATCC 27647 = CGMCC 1.3604]
MRLEDLAVRNVLARPEGNKRNVDDGSYKGITTFAELAERDSQFSDDGKRVVLNIKVEIEDDEGEMVDLYIAPNYSWSKKGKMIKLLEKLDCLPAPGESIDLDDLVGIPVQVIVENVEKDGEVYSNIVSIKRDKTEKVKKKPKPTKEAIRKKALAKAAEERINASEKLFSNDSTDLDLDDEEEFDEVQLDDEDDIDLDDI